MNRKMRRQGKPQGASYADVLARKKYQREMLDNVDEVYANEKLRREAQKCSGTEIEPLYDKEMQEAMERWNEANK